MGNNTNGVLTIESDPLKKVKFWLDALNNPNIDEESKKHLNDCLRLELVAYKTPTIIMKCPD